MSNPKNLDKELAEARELLIAVKDALLPRGWMEKRADWLERNK